MRGNGSAYGIGLMVVGERSVGTGEEEGREWKEIILIGARGRAMRGGVN